MREVFKKAYGKVTLINACSLRIDTNYSAKFTGSPRALVPWLLLTKDPEEYIDSACYPEGFLIRDPSKLTKSNVDKLWRYWEQREKDDEVVLRFIGAKPDDMPPPPTEKPKRRVRKLHYVEIDGRDSSDYGDDDDDEDNYSNSGNDEDEEDDEGSRTGSDDEDNDDADRSCRHSGRRSTTTNRKSGSSSRRTLQSKSRPAAKSLPAKGNLGPSSGSPVGPRPKPVKAKTVTVEPSSPAAHKDDRGTFLRGLSTDSRYTTLLEKMYLLPPFVRVIDICLLQFTNTNHRKRLQPHDHRFRNGPAGPGSRNIFPRTFISRVKPSRRRCQSCKTTRGNRATMARR